MGSGRVHKTFKGTREVDLNTRPTHHARNSKFEWQLQLQAGWQAASKATAKGTGRATTVHPVFCCGRDLFTLVFTWPP